MTCFEKYSAPLSVRSQLPTFIVLNAGGLESDKDRKNCPWPFQHSIFLMAVSAFLTIQAAAGRLHFLFSAAAAADPYIAICYGTLNLALFSAATEAVTYKMPEVQWE